MDTAFAKVVRTANGPAILIDGYVIGVTPPPELGHEICVDAIVAGLRGQRSVTGEERQAEAGTVVGLGLASPGLAIAPHTLGGFTLHPVETSETAE